MNAGNVILKIILFCSLFRFVLFKNTVLESVFDSSILVLLILILKAAKNQQYFRAVYLIYKQKQVHKIISVFTLVFTLAIVLSTITSFLSYVDFGFIKTLTLIAIQLILCIFLFALFKYQGTELDLFDILVNVFVFQAIIQLLSFQFPTFHKLTDMFRTETVIKLGAGIRGLSLDRYDYFNLAGAYGLIYILLAFRWENWHIKSYFWKLIRMFLLIFGGIASSRTALFTLMAALIIRMYVKIASFHGKFRINLRKTFLLLLSFSLIHLQVYLGLKYYQPFRNMANFLLASFSNYFNGRGFTTVSTDVLFHNMYFKLDTMTFLLGKGHFLNESGTGYYMQTDAGFMRLTLYWGIWGQLLLLWFQSLFLNFKIRNKLKRFEAKIILIYILALNVKGAVLGASPILLSMLFLLMLYDKESENEES